MAKNTAEKTKKKIGLSTQIFIALLIGALFGVVIHYWIPSSYIKDTVIVEGVLYVVGQGFIRLMQMLVVPLVFCSLICGSMAIGDTKTLGKVGVKTIGFYLVTTALAVCVALGSALLINPGRGLDMDAVQKGTVSSTTEATSLVDTLLNIIPKTRYSQWRTAICCRSSYLPCLSVSCWQNLEPEVRLWQISSASLTMS